MFFHFTVLAVVANITYFLRITPGMEDYGDQLNNLCRILPTYPLASSVFISGNGQWLAEVRSSSELYDGQSVSPDPWHITNITLDLIATAFHLVLWTFVLFLIENGTLKKFGRSPDFDVDNRQIDEDVYNESKRL